MAAPVVEAPTETATSHIEKARSLSGSYEFEPALRELEFAAALKPTRAEQADIFWLRALGYAALDDTARAAAAVADLLAVKPDATAPQHSSPKVREAFAKGQVVFELRQAVKLEADPPVLEGPTSLDVRVVSGAARITEMTLHYRLEGSSEGFQQLPFVKASAGLYSVKLPRVFPGPARHAALNYFIRARDLAGAVVGQVGSEEALLKSETQTVEASTPIYKSWVLWTVVGVAVAGGVAAPFVVNASAPARVPVGTAGQVVLK